MSEPDSPFEIAIHKSVASLMASGEFRMEETRVLFYVAGACRRLDGRIDLTQRQVADALGMAQPNVARAFVQLKAHSFLCRRLCEPGGRLAWYLDPRRVFLMVRRRPRSRRAPIS